MAAPWIDMLTATISAKSSYVCCGLDPDVTKMPLEFATLDSPEQGIRQFLNEVIRLTIEHVSAFKIQKAFFDLYPSGHELLRYTVQSIRSLDPGVAIVLDAKIGDIENTMDAYYQNFFEHLGVDAAVLNPYMGPDVWAGLRNRRVGGGVILVRTSNPLSAEIQELRLEDGRPFWRAVLDLVLREWIEFRNVIPVLSATADPNTFDEIYQFIPRDMPVFIAGVGVQGGQLSMLSPFVAPDRCGILVNSSRALLYPYRRADSKWRDQVVAATVSLKHSLNAIRS